MVRLLRRLVVGIKNWFFGPPAPGPTVLAVLEPQQLRNSRDEIELLVFELTGDMELAAQAGELGDAFAGGMVAAVLNLPVEEVEEELRVRRAADQA